MTNAGDIDPQYVHEMPSSETLKNIILKQSEDNLDKNSEGIHMNVYDRILKSYEEYAICRNPSGSLEDTSIQEQEIETLENGLPVDWRTRNQIMNKFSHEYCKTCKVDRAPRSEHCDL